MTDAMEAGESRRQTGVPLVDREYQTPWQDVKADGKEPSNPGYSSIPIFRSQTEARDSGISDIREAEHKSANSRSYLIRPPPHDVHSYYAGWQFEHRHHGKEQYRCGFHLGVFRKLVYLMAFMAEAYSSLRLSRFPRSRYLHRWLKRKSEIQ